MTSLSPHFQVALDGLMTNSIERLTLGNNPYHFLYLSGAKRLQSGFACCTSLQTITIHLKNATPEALTALLTGAALCRSLRHVNIVGGVCKREAKSLSGGFMSFCLPATTAPAQSPSHRRTDHRVVSPAMERKRKKQLESSVVVEDGGVAWAWLPQGRGRLRQPPQRNTSRGHPVGTTPRRENAVCTPPPTKAANTATCPTTPIELNLSLYHLTEGAAAVLLEGLRHSERFTSGRVQLTGVSREARPALDRLSSRLETVLARNRHRMMCVGHWLMPEPKTPPPPLVRPARTAKPSDAVSAAVRPVLSARDAGRQRAPEVFPRKRPPIAPPARRGTTPGASFRGKPLTLLLNGGFDVCRSAPARAAPTPNGYNVKSRWSSSEAWSLQTPPSRRYSPPQLISPREEAHARSCSPTHIRSDVSSRISQWRASCAQSGAGVLSPSPSPRPPNARHMSPPSPRSHYVRSTKALKKGEACTCQHEHHANQMLPNKSERLGCGCFVCNGAENVDPGAEEEEEGSNLVLQPRTPPEKPALSMADILAAAASTARHLSRRGNWAPLSGRSTLLCVSEEVATDLSDEYNGCGGARDHNGATPTQERSSITDSTSVSREPNSLFPFQTDAKKLENTAAPQSGESARPSSVPGIVSSVTQCLQNIRARIHNFDNEVDEEADALARRIRCLGRSLSADVSTELNAATERLREVQINT